MSRDVSIWGGGREKRPKKFALSFKLPFFSKIERVVNPNLKYDTIVGAWRYAERQTRQNNFNSSRNQTVFGFQITWYKTCHALKDSYRQNSRSTRLAGVSHLPFKIADLTSILFCWPWTSSTMMAATRRLMVIMCPSWMPLVVEVTCAIDDRRRIQLRQQNSCRLTHFIHRRLPLWWTTITTTPITLSN